MKPFRPNLQIREVNIDCLTAGGDTSFSFMKENENNASFLTAIEIPYIYDDFYPEILKKLWNADDFEQRLKHAQSTPADIVSVKFNISEINEKEILAAIKAIEKNVKKPVIYRGANNSKTDRELLPLIARNLMHPSVIAFGEEETYKDIVPEVIKGGHILSLRSPIDINIAKELNILSTDMGLSPDRILIDPDMGGLGYGLEYGYSIMEKIRQAAFEGDNMLNMPVIAFIGEESYRTKETKSKNFPASWGKYETRAQLWETTAAAALISAGANIVVLWNPENVSVIKGLLK